MKTNIKKDRNQSFLNPIIFKWGIVVLSILIVLIIIPGEKVPYNDGAGWDGLAYRDVAFGFSGQIQGDGYNQYMMQRLLPFAVLNLTYNLFDIPLNNDNLMHGILILNFLALVLGLWWYFDLVKHLKFSENLQTVGFILLFVNFPVIKETWYAPFTTDLIAFVLGIGQLTFFVKGKKLYLFLITLISGFVWPTSFLVGLILLFLPKNLPVRTQEPFLFKKWMWIVPMIVYTLLFIGFFKFSTRSDKPILELIRHVVSLAAVFLLLYCILKNTFLDWKKNLLVFFQNWKPKDMVLFFISIITFYIAIHWLSNDEPAFGLRSFLSNMLVRPIQWPFNFLANHFLYFGILIPLSIYYFRPFFDEVSHQGVGYTLLLFFILFLSINSESRIIINVIPFFILPLLLVLKNFQFSTNIILVFLLFNLFLSKFWYTINAPGIAEAFETYSTEVYMTFPAQRYFQHAGPWQSPQMYLIYLIGLILSLFLINKFHTAWSSNFLTKKN